jgi:hypothetical protein
VQRHGDFGDDIGSGSGAAGISREDMRSDSEWLVPKIGVSSGYLVRRFVSFFGARLT